MQSFTWEGFTVLRGDPIREYTPTRVLPARDIELFREQGERLHTSFRNLIDLLGLNPGEYRIVEKHVLLRFKVKEGEEYTVKLLPTLSEIHLSSVLTDDQLVLLKLRAPQLAPDGGLLQLDDDSPI